MTKTNDNDLKEKLIDDVINSFNIDVRELA